MAAKKNRKQANNVGAQAPSQNDMGGKKEKKPDRDAVMATSCQQVAAKKVGMSTFVACMFLIFILGIYIGTLVRDMQTVMDGHKHEAQSMPAAVNNQPNQAMQAQSAMQGEIAARIVQLEQTVAVRHDDTGAWVELGNLYFDINNAEKSINAYEHALALNPRLADVWTDMGIMYRETKNYQKALQCFRKAIEINPKHVNAMFNEGVLLSSNLGKKDEAIAAWERLLKISPNAVAPDGRSVSELIRNLR